jgi:hypothetical protein
MKKRRTPRDRFLMFMRRTIPEDRPQWNDQRRQPAWREALASASE